MAIIHLIVRMECTEEEIKSYMVQKIQELAKKLEPGLELVKKSCEDKFPGLSVKWTSVDPQGVDYEEDPIDEGIWKVLYSMHITTTSPDGCPESDFCVNEYDRWSEIGEPPYEQVIEYLHEANWSEIRPFCEDNPDALGEVVWVEFDSIRPTPSHSSYHFNNRTIWL